METFADYNIKIPERGGTNRYAKCPECSDSRKPSNRNTACLSVNVEKGVWNCHHCGWKGALKTGRPTESVYIPPRPIHYNKPEKVDDTVKEYLLSRGITAEVLERFQITSTVRNFGKEALKAIQFPYFKDGQVVNIKYRTRDKRFSQESGAEKIFYGYDDISETTIITEGEFDKLALAVAGFDNAISVPDGAPAVNTQNYQTKFDYLGNCEAKLQTVQHFILAVDNDEPGRKLEEELSRRLGRYRCSRVIWPQGCKDANDVLLKHGSEALATCIYEAVDYPIEGLINISDQSLEHYYDHGIGPGLNPGWPNFGKLYTVKPGQLTVITGAPNSGKSEFLDAMLVNLAVNHEWRFMVFSPENAPTESHITKLAEKKVGKTAQRNYLGRMEKEEYLAATKWVREHFEFVNPECTGHTLDRLMEMAQELLLRSGIQGLVIDPWNQLEHERPKHLSETEYIGKCLSRIVQFARQNDIHIFVVAHPAKLRKEKHEETGEMYYPPATLYDIAGSANWNNKADMGLSVYRSPRDGAPVTVFVQKVRFARSDGQRGEQNFMYDPRIGTYTEWEGRN